MTMENYLKPPYTTWIRTGYLNNDRAASVIEWCEKYLEKQFLRCMEGFMFESKSDAMLFTLRWS